MRGRSPPLSGLDGDHDDDELPAELRTQRNSAWAADEAKYEARRPVAEAKAVIATERPRLERRLLAAAKNNYQRRLVKVALKHTPDDVCIRFNRGSRFRGEQITNLAHLWRVTLREPPTTLLSLLVWLHEIRHKLMLQQQLHARSKAA